LQKHLRLRHREDFALIRTHGQMIPHRFFLLTYLANTLLHNRYGFVVSRRLGNAVQRNKIRRRLREALRSYDPMITGSDQRHYDVVVVARVAVVGASFQEIYEALGNTLRQAGLLVV
jgi:ribonuclease P protein component